MRPNQPRTMWLAFASAVLVVIAAMGWTTRAVLRLDAAEAESRRRAQLEENVRLALWRMDSALAPLIAAEHARPAGAYSRGPGSPPESPPLPGTGRHFARQYFQYAADGTAESFTRGQSDAAELRRVAPFQLLNDALPRLSPPPEPGAIARAPVQNNTGGRGAQEYQARALNNAQQIQVQAAVNRMAGDDDAAAGRSAAVMRPVWNGTDLVLARRVLLGQQSVIQGCWVDWPGVEAWLAGSVSDLLPRAALEPMRREAAPDDRLLASLPVRLVPGDLAAVDSETRPSPLRTSLVVAWACVLVATAAVALLLRGVVSLSERRGAFVSAVTHELRTPLTTLRMYTEMLEGGMVADPARRQNYLATLRAEADRLGHLVENVLAYSRLERNRAGYEVTVLKLGDVLPRIAERLAERARQSGMELVVDVAAEVSEQPVRTNALALEQILFNLVDNACKYAAGGADKPIQLCGAAHDQTDTVHVAVRDHGPGVAPAVARRLFHPFSKSVQEAANTAPGLGLGLSLSRRLAESMGGGLWLDPSLAKQDGARFILSLPRE